RPRGRISSFNIQVWDLSGSFWTLRGMIASRLPQTATYSDGPGLRESVRQAANPTRSTKSSACGAVSTRPVPSRCQRESRYSSMLEERGGRCMDRIIYSKLQNRSAIACLVFQLLIVSACTRRAQDQPEVSADILAEVNRIRA